MWFAFPDQIQDARLLTAYNNLLSPDEQVQRQRFYFDRDRHQYLVARAVVRATLSRYADVAPRCWRFSRNDHGKPEILSPEIFSQLRFNLSHTRGLIVCAIALNQDIGVDVEDTERRGKPMEIADRFFSPEEVSDLRHLSEERKLDRFFDYWTLKESYIKARGMGLSVPLDQFSFHFSANKTLRISFDPRLPGNPHHWQFWLLKPTRHHKAALSVCHDGRGRYQLVAKKVTPLVKEQEFICPVLGNNPLISTKEC
ncbi:MAG: 4'-phosphopantetheinyl transferase superfamily protein [Desulfobacterales bacterium]|nr:4'-phosphopantetheinyl transferase superfamily protein [Desulfobacterales bacterium]